MSVSWSQCNICNYLSLSLVEFCKMFHNISNSFQCCTNYVHNKYQWQFFGFYSWKCFRPTKNVREHIWSLPSRWMRKENLQYELVHLHLSFAEAFVLWKWSNHDCSQYLLCMFCAKRLRNVFPWAESQHGKFSCNYSQLEIPANSGVLLLAKERVPCLSHLSQGQSFLAFLVPFVFLSLHTFCKLK